MLNSKPTVLHVLHDAGGGIAKHVVELSALLGNNINSLIIMPVNTNGKKLLSICSVKSSDLQLNLKIDEKEAYQVLAQLNISLIHIHHLIGQIPLTFLLLNQNLGIPFYVTVHDYTLVCPQINFVNSWGKYCNESTDTTTCNNCLSVGNQFQCKDIDAWRKELACIFNKAAKVICPSIDALLKIKKYHPTANCIVAAHDQIVNTLVAVPNIKPGDTLRIAVLGEITYIKGNKVVEQLVKLAREYKAKLHITVIGQVVGGVVIKPDEYYKETGVYNDANLLKIIDSVNPHVILFTAICPETYSYTLSTAIESQRPIITPDFGAFPERVSGRAWTWVFKHTDPVEQLFNLLNKIREENFYKQLAPKAYTFNTTEKITVNFYANGYLHDCL